MNIKVAAFTVSEKSSNNLSTISNHCAEYEHLPSKIKKNFIGVREMSHKIGFKYLALTFDSNVLIYTQEAIKQI